MRASKKEKKKYYSVNNVTNSWTENEKRLHSLETIEFRIR